MLFFSRVYGFTMAEIWLADVSVSLDESVNHRSNETQCRLSANGRGRSRHTSCGPMGWLDSSVGGVAERSVGMNLLKIKLSALTHKVDHCVNHCCVSGKCFAGMLIPICWSD